MAAGAHVSLELEGDMTSGWQGTYTIASWIVAGLLVSGPVGAGVPITLLDADFDDKTPDAPIGTGGAAAGEPVSVGGGVIATVRDAPTPTPSLEIADDSDFSASTVRFEFDDQIEATDGTVTIACDLWFVAFEDFILYVREQGSAADQYVSMRFDDSGQVIYSDEGGGGGQIGTYETGRIFPVRLVYRMKDRTYDVFLDGVIALDNASHGVAEGGVGAVLFGHNSDTDLEGLWYLDNLLVTGDGVTPVNERTWGGVKSAFGPPR